MGAEWKRRTEEKEERRKKKRRKQSGKNVNMVSEFQTKEPKHSTFLSLTLLLRSPQTALGCQATRILWKLCQRDGERVREREQERKARTIEVAVLIGVIGEDVYA